MPLTRPHVPAEAAELAVTWLGHSTVLLEVEGRRVLVDPVWGDRVSPSPLFGPRRLHAPPLPLADLPPVDAVLVSHDHYDHLDLPTVRALLHRTAAPFVVPLGVGQHLRGWGVPEDRVVELDWDGATTVAGLTLACTREPGTSPSGGSAGTTPSGALGWSAARRRAVFFAAGTPATPRRSPGSARGGVPSTSRCPGRGLRPGLAGGAPDPRGDVRVHGDLGGGLLLPVHWPRSTSPSNPWPNRCTGCSPRPRGPGRRSSSRVPGTRVDVLDPPDVEDWWTAVGSVGGPPVRAPRHLSLR